MATRTKILTKASSIDLKKHEAPKKAIFTDSEESDPEFVNGASYVKEPKARKKFVTNNSSKRIKRLKVGSSAFLSEENPLKKWLGSDVDIKPASESEYDFDTEMSDEDVLESESFTTSRRKTSLMSGRNPPANDRTLTAVEDDSITEPDSDQEMRLVKQTKTHQSSSIVDSGFKSGLASHDESLTEPESDEDVAISRKRKATRVSNLPSKKVKIASSKEGSVTEPDSDKDASVVNHSMRLSGPILPVKQSCRPRPAFKPSTAQPSVGPFVLDHTQNIQVNASINRWLRDYQRDGVRFFYERYKEGRGGILGDDMGLGKTIQVIAFLSAIMKKIGDSRDSSRRQEHVNALQDSDEWRSKRRLPPANEFWPTCLIIAPASVVPNWERELETWGYFEVEVYTGYQDQRAQILKDFELGRLDILIMSIERALRDIGLIESQAWSCIFVDEVHRVKNPRSQTSIALNRFNCEVRFGLTGTAIQNDLQELWTILDWSNPGRVGTMQQWNEWVTRPLTYGQNSKATDEEIATGRIVAERLVTRLLPNFFKRRTKDIIADQLPRKIDLVVFCPLTETQKQVYRRVLATSEVKAMLKKEELCECGSKKLGKSCCLKDWNSGWTFQYIHILSKISNHLALILPAPMDTPEQTQRHREQANIGWPPVNGIPTAPSYGEAVFDPRLCGKWKVLKDLLTTWNKEGDNKVLIFTKSVKLIEMLEQRLKEIFVEFRKLDGSVKQKDRMRIIDEFNDDPTVFAFLISITAGGVGLNLVGANKVVIFDPNWNPAHDLQAMDRAYRFGQRRDVYVYRFLGAGSLEEVIYRRQIYKQQQMKIGYEASHQTRYFEGVQGDKTKQGDLFGIKNIFTLDESGTATKHTIEKSILAQLDWALAHLDGKQRHAPEEGVALDEKAGKLEVDLKGLGALFFGSTTADELLPQQPEAKNEIEKILDSNGISYTHHSDTILRASAIETKLATKAIEIKKKNEAAQRNRRGKVTKKPEIPWPPKRKHHAVKWKHRLSGRMSALITLGYIKAPEDLPRFAEDFLKKSEEDQMAMLSELDKENARLEVKNAPKG